MGHFIQFEPNWPPTNHNNNTKATGVHISDVTMSRYGVSNHRHLDYLFNRLLRWTLQKASKLRVTGLCEVNPLVTGGFPSQRAGNLEEVSVWWRHHGLHYEEFMIWKRCSFHWLLVRGIHMSTANFTHQGPVIWSLGVFYVVRITKLLNKHLRCQWFETT